MKQKRLLILLIAFICIEVLAVLVALWPYFFMKVDINPPELRLGIVPSESKEESEKLWKPFLAQVNSQGSFRIVPYFANSNEEAVKGFIYGSLDLLYINPACFLYLKENYGAEEVLYHRYSDKELEMNRAVLVTLREKAEFFKDTKDFKLCFTDKYSMSGYMVPRKYLNDKLPGGLEKWFSEISFVPTRNEALEKLFEKQTDVIAINSFMLYWRFRREAGYSDKFRILWSSMRLPEPLICVSPLSAYLEDDKKHILEAFVRSAGDTGRGHSVFNMLSMTFLPVDFVYTEKLNKLQKYLKGVKVTE